MVLARSWNITKWSADSYYCYSFNKWILLKINAFSAIFILAQKEKTSLSQTLIVRVIQTSKQYEDGLHLELEKQQKLGILSIFVHCKCVDKYCHKKTIQRAIQEKSV